MYSVFLAKKAEDCLTKLDKPQQIRIREKLHALKENPRLGKPLTANLAGFWSLRVGDYRIIYEIKDEKLFVFVIKIGHRKNIY